MLVLSRKRGERIQIGENISITILRTGETIRVGIDAPADIKVLRSELLQQVPAPQTSAAKP